MTISPTNSILNSFAHLALLFLLVAISISSGATTPTSIGTKERLVQDGHVPTKVYAKRTPPYFPEYPPSCPICAQVCPPIAFPLWFVPLASWSLLADRATAIRFPLISVYPDPAAFGLQSFDRQMGPYNLTTYMRSHNGLNRTMGTSTDAYKPRPCWPISLWQVHSRSA